MSKLIQSYKQVEQVIVNDQHLMMKKLNDIFSCEKINKDRTINYSNKILKKDEQSLTFEKQQDLILTPSAYQTP